jgi:hypothetical protein
MLSMQPCETTSLDPTGGHIPQKSLVCMAAFELGLPHMVMRIDKSRRDDLACAVHDLRVRREWDDLRGDL